MYLCQRREYLESQVDSVTCNKFIDEFTCILILIFPFCVFYVLRYSQVMDLHLNPSKPKKIGSKKKKIVKRQFSIS